MYYILGFVGQRIDELKIKGIIKSLHKDDYKTPKYNLRVNVIFLSETLLDDSLHNQLKFLNTTMNLSYKNKNDILLDIYQNKIKETIYDDLTTITYIIINDIKHEDIITLMRKFDFHQLYFFSKNKKPLRKTDYYAYIIINKIIQVFYDTNYLEHLYTTDDLWINPSVKGEFDYKILDSIKNLRQSIHKKIDEYMLIKNI